MATFTEPHKMNNLNFYIMNNLRLWNVMILNELTLFFKVKEA